MLWHIRLILCHGTDIPYGCRFKSRVLYFWPSSLLTAWEGSREWLKSSSGTPRRSSCLPALDQPSSGHCGHLGANQQMEDLSVCPSLSLLTPSNNKSFKWHEHIVLNLINWAQEIYTMIPFKKDLITYLYLKGRIQRVRKRQERERNSSFSGPLHKRPTAGTRTAHSQESGIPCESPMRVAVLGASAAFHVL